MLIDHFYVVNPKSCARRTDIGTAVAAVKLEYEMGGILIGRGPSLLMNGNVLPLAVKGVIGALACNRPHSAPVPALLADVSIMDVELFVFLPSVCRLVEAHAQCTYTLGVEVAL